MSEIALYALSAQLIADASALFFGLCLLMVIMTMAVKALLFVRSFGM